MDLEEEDEEEPPTEYDEDGVLRTSLHSFSDVRIVNAMAPDPSAPGQQCHAYGNENQLAPKLSMTDTAFHRYVYYASSQDSCKALSAFCVSACRPKGEARGP